MLWHDGLMIKLKKLGLDGEIVQFIRNFLIGRTMQVKVGNQLSQSMTIENGTPQESVISPLLFLITIHDLPDTVKSSLQNRLYSLMTLVFSNQAENWMLLFVILLLFSVA